MKDEVLKKLEDDFQSKADFYHDRAKVFYEKEDYDLAMSCDQQAHAFEYCAMMVRQAIK